LFVQNIKNGDVLVKVRVCLALVTLLFGSALSADEVGDLRDIARLSEDYRELTVDCLIEIKIDKAKGWVSEECERYKHFSAGELHDFKVEIKKATSAFKEYSKSGSASKNRIKRGLKQLILIQENMESVGEISDKIKVESKS
jgi:hypothetical protein